MKVNTIINFLSVACLFSISLLAGGCEKDTTPPARHFEATMDVDGRSRSYIVNLPPTYYDDTVTYSLVIGLHGTAGSAEQFEKDYGFSKKADQAGFVAVYPNGVSRNGGFSLRTWNAGTCCDFAMRSGVNDVAFISNLIDKMTNNYRIDPKRVYVTGMSNGAMMTYRLAAELSHKIAAIAPVSGTMVYTPPASQGRAVPILHLHSILDKIVPYHGGTNALDYYFPAVDSVLRVWVQRNQMIPDMHVVTDDERYKLVHWLNKNGDTSIVHYMTKDGGHAWPGGRQARPQADPPSKVINANDLIWDFFRKYRLE